MPDTSPPKVQRAHVKLDRAQRAEVQLASLTIVEAETRVRAAVEALVRAKADVGIAQEKAQGVQDGILDELGLSPANIIDVSLLVVLPPPGEIFVEDL